MSNESNRKVVHIAAHVGGGVGRVVLNYVSKNNKMGGYSHKILTLGYSDDKASFTAKTYGFQIADNLASDHQKIIEEMRKADIVLIHWWNHPLLYDFLVNNPLPESRIVMWSHISGTHAPQVFTNKIVDYADLFVFTTPLSLSTQDIIVLPQEIKDRLRVIWSTGGLEHVRSIKKVHHSGFNIGYIGTVDYAKMNRNFIKICDKIDIPDARFIICGGPNEKSIAQETRELGIDEKFKFTGHVSDVSEYLKNFDVFGYPLSPEHYGTCDQVLAECMAAKVVPVVLANGMEKYMVKHRITGMVAKNEDDYVKFIKLLYQDRKLRESLSSNAHKYALETFSLDKMSDDWKKIFDEAMSIPKKGRNWPVTVKKKMSKKDVFLESLGPYGQVFQDYIDARTDKSRKLALKKIKGLGASEIWHSQTKGTVHNYKGYFPKDRHLNLWSKTILGNN
jgi:L-malate glycosyltransferase